MAGSDDVVDFDTAKKRVKAVRQEEKEKDLEKRFKKAIGWKEKRKVKIKKKPGNNGPQPPKPGGKGKRR